MKRHVRFTRFSYCFDCIGRAGGARPEGKLDSVIERFRE